MDELTPEEFEKKDKAAQARQDAAWERAKAKGMSKKEFLEARHRGQLKASRDIADIEKRMGIEPRFNMPRSGGGVGGGVDIEGLPKRLRPGGGKQFKKGGYVKAADGCVKKGHTKGKMV